jgi:hypothetical protein
MIVVCVEIAACSIASSSFQILGKELEAVRSVHIIPDTSASQCIPCPQRDVTAKGLLTTPPQQQTMMKNTCIYGERSISPAGIVCSTCGG